MVLNLLLHMLLGYAALNSNLLKCKRITNNASMQGEIMQAERFYHKCGRTILVVKKPVGPATQTFYVDGDNPVIENKNGEKTPRVIKQCPECGGSILPERLLTKKPEVVQDKRPTGYIPGKM